MPDPATATTATPLRVAVDLGPPVLHAGVLAILDRYPQRVRSAVRDGLSPDVLVRIAGTRTADGWEEWRERVPVLTLTWPGDPDEPRDPGDPEHRARRTGTTLSIAASAEEVVRAVLLTHARAAQGSRRRLSSLRRDALSPRERDVLRLICSGMSNREMAEHLMIGINSVKTHIRLAYLKMGVDNRARAVLWGLEHGYGTPGPSGPEVGRVGGPVREAKQRPHASSPSRP